MGNRGKPGREVDTSCSHASTSDDLSETEEEATTPPPPRRSSHGRRTSKAQRNTRDKEDNVIQILEKNKKDIIKEMCRISKKMTKQFDKLTESLNDLRKQLEAHINGSSGDDSSALRSEINQVQRPPRYRLKFTCEIKDEIQKGQVIETKEKGETITVGLYDEKNQIVQIEPYASLNVVLVVLNGEFNEHDNQYNWSRKDFERNIKRPRQGNSSMADEHQMVESIVSNCVFTLDRGVQSHSDATILYNSSNKKVRLGVMVLSPTEERVLEGLSNHFFVRGCDRPKRQKQSMVDGNHQEGNGPMVVITQNRAYANVIQQNPTCANVIQPDESRSSDDQILRQLFDSSNIMDQDMISDNLVVNESSLLVPRNSTQFNTFNQIITNPVQLIWNRPNIEPSKHCWNLLDHLDSYHPKFHNSGLPTTRLKPEQYGSLMIMPDAEACRKRGVRIEPLELDDSDEGRPLKRKLHSKYHLGFVKEVCKAYCTWEQIKADDGSLLKVALFDENNMKITTGPLSSVSVDVVVLHGDFNVDGQDYWSSEEFSSFLVRPLPSEAATILGGESILVLANGEACLSDAFFKMNSFCARTRKFKMGVMLLSSAQEERIQEGISEPFEVTDYRVKELHGKHGPANKANFNALLPRGFLFHPTDEELIQYLCDRADGKPCPIPIMDGVDIYKSDPWDLPAKAVYGEHEWYFFYSLDHKYPNSVHTNRVAGSGYWKTIVKDMQIDIHSVENKNKVAGIKGTLVFYIGCAPKGRETPWTMHEYRLEAKIIQGSSSDDSSMRLMTKEWVMCKIFCRTKQLQLSSPPMGEVGLGKEIQSAMPPGFRFHPTDEELIVNYLQRRANAMPCPVSVINEVDIYKFDPWDLPERACFGDREWYFFSPRDRKYPNGVRHNRAAGSGYWKATGTDKPILRNATGVAIGVRKALVFYKGCPPKGSMTNWIMHEYRLSECLSSSKNYGRSMRMNEWVLCRIFKKTMTTLKPLDSSPPHVQPLCLSPPHTAYIQQSRQLLTRVQDPAARGVHLGLSDGLLRAVRHPADATRAEGR